MQNETYRPRSKKISRIALVRSLAMSQPAAAISMRVKKKKEKRKNGKSKVSSPRTTNNNEHKRAQHIAGQLGAWTRRLMNICARFNDSDSIASDIYIFCSLRRASRAALKRAFMLRGPHFYGCCRPSH